MWRPERRKEKEVCKERKGELQKKRKNRKSNDGVKRKWEKCEGGSEENGERKRSAERKIQQLSEEGIVRKKER